MKNYFPLTADPGQEFSCLPFFYFRNRRFLKLFDVMCRRLSHHFRADACSLHFYESKSAVAFERRKTGSRLAFCDIMCMDDFVTLAHEKFIRSSKPMTIVRFSISVILAVHRLLR